MRRATLCRGTGLTAALMALAGAAASAVAGPPAWSSPAGASGADNVVRALATADLDGDGPARAELFVGGDFATIAGVSAARIARYNGSFWFPLGGGVNAPVRALAQWDADGPGPGPTLLIVGGDFTLAGAVPASRIAAWNGSGWSALGAGVAGRVSALASFDIDGAGPASADLIAAGFFSSAGSVSASNIARWDGAQWSPLDAGFDNEGLALLSFDADGPGGASPLLYAAGWFGQAGSVDAARVAVWNGAAWSALGAGLSGPFPAIGRCLASFDPDGPGPAAEQLHVGGIFTVAGESPALGAARWDGAAWHPLAQGIGHPADALAIAPFDDTPGDAAPPALFFAGAFAPVVGAVALNFAGWDGAAWSASAGDVDRPVFALAAFDEDGPGPDSSGLYVGGNFLAAGPIAAVRLARWGPPRVTPLLCPDLSGDGAVNFPDLTLVLAAWGAASSPSDVTQDGVVNFQDLTAVLSAWGRICP
ncbi:MAG: hypothetical protein SFZ24_05145 [Planctomycetota bacterium]|nr:hypothetical protein [Planctomycetota bacterium]